MRIALLTASFDPVVGGAESYALNLAEGFSQLGHEVLVVTDTPHGVVPGEELARPYHLIRLLAYRDRLFDPQKLPWEEMAFALTGELERALSDFDPDVLVSNSLDTAVQAALVRRSTGVPWVAAFHEHAPQDEPLGAGRMSVVYGDLRPDAVLAGSKFYADRARHHGPPDAVHLIHHGVPLVEVAPDVIARWRHRYDVAPNDLLVVCVGRLKERKGIIELVRAFAAQDLAVSGLRLVVAGTVSSASSAYLDQVCALVAEHDLGDRVTIDQTVVADQVSALMAAADVVAQPSHEEGLGLAVLEGMAARRPVLTTHAVGIDEIVFSEDLALRVPARDPEALAAGLGRLVADAALRERYAERGRAHVETNFSLKLMVDRTAEVLTGVVDRRGQRSS